MTNSFFFGTQYYRPPTPDCKDWDKDLAQIRRLGMNAIKIWMTWGYVEPTPGKYRFGELDRLFDLAEKHALQVVPNINSVEMAPFWVERRFPDARRVFAGAKLAAQTSDCCTTAVASAYCLDHPELRKRVEAYLHALAERYAPRANLLVWDAWNELMGIGCECRHTVDRYRTWLKNKYGGSLDRLNRAWKRRYGSWAEIIPPTTRGCHYTDMLEWGLFTIENTAAAARCRVDAIKRHDPRHIVMIHPGASGLTGCSGNITCGGDDWPLSQTVDLYGTSWAPFSREQKEHDTVGSFQLDAIRSAAGEHGYWISELHTAGPAVGGFEIGPTPTSQDQRFWIWLAIAHGAQGVFFWQYRPELAGLESPGWGIVNPDGTLTERAHKLGDLSRTLREHGPAIVAAKPVKAKIAILVDPEIYLMNHAASRQSPDLISGSVKGYYAVLCENNIPCDFLHITELARIADYAVVIMPFPMLIKEKTASVLGTYVAKGGCLVVDAYFGRFTDDWFCAENTPPAGLDKVLGYKGIETKRADRVSIFLKHAKAGFDVENTYLKETFKAEADAEVLAYFDAGRKEPAVLYNTYGQGKTLFIGTLLGYAYWKSGNRRISSFLSACLKRMGVKPGFDITPQGSVRVRLLEGSDYTYLICHNFGPAQSVGLTCRLSFPVHKACEVNGGKARYELRHDRARLQFHLEDHGVMVFHLTAKGGDG